MRCMYGFSEGDLDASIDPGCLGTDDVSVQQAGIHDLGPAFFGESPSLVDSTSAQLALPTLILALNSRPTRHMPVLLGIAYALNIGLHGQLAISAFPAGDDAARVRLGLIADRARPWLERAIDMGFEAGELRLWAGDATRWGEHVAIGFELGLRGLSSSSL